jgi:hypothetical protein
MTQTTAAAERSAHVVREVITEHGVGPCIEVAPGVWKLRVVVELERQRDAIAAERDAAQATAKRLRKGLTDLGRAYVRLLEIGRDRIMDLGGACDPVDVMEAGDPALRAARALVAEAGLGQDDQAETPTAAARRALDSARNRIRFAIAELEGAVAGIDVEMSDLEVERHG